MAEPNSRLASEQEARDVAEDAREQEWENGASRAHSSPGPST